MYSNTKCKSTARRRARRPKLRNRILSSVVAVSLLCGNFVMLPSVAAEATAYCGLEEHTHNDVCYQETDKLICEIKEGHVHSGECWKTESTLTCGNTENVHTHTDACSTVTETLVCTEHVHTADCRKSESTLICEDTAEDHEHTDECYTVTETLICEYPDSTHVHAPECWTSETALTCGYHQHEETCYEDTEVQICGVAEENHAHTEACWTTKSTRVCELEEHTHDVACYSDSTADTETSAEWEADLPEELTDVWAEDLLAVAKSQLNYQESTRNYLVAEDGKTLMGYNRYGAWLGSYGVDETMAYQDWNLYFLLFCVNYAGIEDFPLEVTFEDLIDSLEQYELYREVGKTYPVSEEDTEGAAYSPVSGDLVFIDTNEDSTADRVGVISEIKDDELTAIEGDVEGAVAEVTYALTEAADAAASEDTEPEPKILGYADMTKAQADADTEKDASILGTNTPTVYFAVPIDWTNNNYVIKVFVRCGAEGDGYNKTALLAMTDTGKKDSSGRKIYKYTFTSSECPYGGFYQMYFQALDSNDGWICEYKAINSSWKDSDTINGKQWTPNSTVTAGNASTDGSWGDYSPAENPDVGEVTELPAVPSGKRRVFFDATLSKLSYEADGVGSYEIPARGSNVVYCWADQRYVMTKLTSYTSGGHTYTDVYYVDIPQSCTTVTFASFALTSATNYGWSGESTKQQTIPSGLTNPCFYADSSDQVIYNSSSTNQRGGYWDEAFSVRDAEAGKGNDVVNITSETFVEDRDALYVTSTFYDYYTDYELNGYNRDGYGSSNGASMRNWVTFRQFNQALSDYYEDNQVSYPLYEGHFQPSIYGDAYQFDYIAGTLDLYGYNGSTDYEFFSSNNSALNAWGTQEWSGEKLYNYAAQGLVDGTLLADGNVAAAGSASILPFFNSDFLLGNNSKNTVLGDVYQNVSFPFKKQDIDNNGVEYWVFDSAETTLEMKQSGGQYYLEDVGKQSWAMNVNSSGTTSGDAVSNTYGFFPFNKGSTGNSGSTYNYGFGCRLDIDFRLTEDCTVLDENGDPVDITFQFSGDDDVWVFIDGLLVLDVGGEHGEVEGTINFADRVSTVSRVKTSEANKGVVTPEDNNGGKNYTTGFPSVLQSDDAWDGEHTLTMFYMERGMWESNMKITFNFPDENILEVEKQVNDSAVNSMFGDLFSGKELFTFNIKTLATHFGTKEASTGSDGQKSVVSPDEKSGTDVTLSSCSGITFRNGNDNTAVGTDKYAQIYWKSDQDDSTKAKRASRYGQIALASPFALSGYQYLEFDIYYDWSDTPSLSNLFIDLVDASGNTLLKSANVSASGYVSGSVTMTNNKWITVRLDLSKMVSNYGTLAAIRIGYDYGRNVYIRNITFQPTTVVENTIVGFIMPQKEIPDYGTANTEGKAGTLQIPVNAVYTSSSGTSYRIGTDGKFTLSDGESVTFQDQFRRGSYMYLEEESSYLYSTSWTMYEGRGETLVTSSSLPDGYTSTTVSGGGQSMQGVGSTKVTDGRVEKIGLLTGESSGDNKYQSNGKAESPGNTFVFRHYSDPDNANVATKLKIVYTNTIKTGSLTIGKAKADSSEDFAADQEFTFYVEFYNLGGMNLESSPIIAGPYTLKVGETEKIDGIPLGTWFNIHEVKDEDDSIVLENATYDLGSYGTGTMIPSDSTVNGAASYSVQGLIPTTGSSSVSYTFNNSKKSTVSLTVKKAWDTDGATGITIPNSILVQLQRSTNGTDWTAVTGYENVTLQRDYTEWEDYFYTFEDLDRYTDKNKTTEYSYRVVELQAVTGNDGSVTYEPIDEGGLLTVTDDTQTETNYEVSYGTVENVKDENNAAIEDEFTQTITNKLKAKAQVTVTKEWVAPTGVTNPESVTVQLQRRTGSNDFTAITGLADVTLNATNKWTHTFENLDEKDADGKAYEFRVVELDSQSNVISANGTLSASSIDYRVTYSGTDGKADLKTGTTNEYTQTITNSAVPDVTLQITKLDATNTTKKLAGVEFKLEKKDDTTFTAMEATTNTDGIASFAGLKAGTYTLTETKAASGYSLLKSSIEIEITENTDETTGAITYTATVDGGNAESFTQSGNTYTLGMTVYNKQGLTMPSTGGVHGFEFWILGGLCITAIPLLLYTLLGFKKGGKYSRK